MFKKIGKFIKRGLKKVGKFFKRAFKKVGKFMGKLGPVGMLGMMLIMPQLGSWWAQFGEWAGTLAQPFKFGMEAIHWAGSQIGKAYSTITEGIDKIVGGFADTVGLGDQYKDFRSWMDTKLEKTREFVGLKTENQLALERTGFEKSDIDLDKGKVDLKANEATVVEKLERNILDKASSYEPFDPKTNEVSLKTQTQVADESLYGFESDPSKLDIGGSITEEKSLFDKAKGIYSGYESATKIAEKFGIGQEEYDPYYYSFVAELGPMYESAQFDWTQQGFGGTPAYGIGNANYLQSVSNAFGTDPYYQWMAQLQTRSA